MLVDQYLDNILPGEEAQGGGEEGGGGGTEAPAPHGISFSWRGVYPTFDRSLRVKPFANPSAN